MNADSNKSIMMKDLPESVWDPAAMSIKDYSIGLLVLFGEVIDDTVEPIGSGTLIKYKDLYGILTARHVVEDNRFKKSMHIGLNLYCDSHRFVLETDILRILKLGSKSESDSLPDLAIIVIPPNKLGWLGAKKLFWNLLKWKPKLEETAIPLRSGIHIVSGIPALTTQNVGPDSQFRNVICNTGYAYASGIERITTIGEYDYFDVIASYEEVPDLPQTFGGVSGGGLWQIPIEFLPSGDYKALTPILTGIAISESAIINSKRTIRCHGRDSIYKKLIEEIERSFH